MINYITINGRFINTDAITNIEQSKKEINQFNNLFNLTITLTCTTKIVLNFRSALDRENYFTKLKVFLQIDSCPAFDHK